MEGWSDRCVDADVEADSRRVLEAKDIRGAKLLRTALRMVLVMEDMGPMDPFLLMC